MFTYTPNLDIPPKILRGAYRRIFQRKTLFYEKRVSKYVRLTVYVPGVPPPLPQSEGRHTRLRVPEWGGPIGTTEESLDSSLSTLCPSYGGSVTVYV